MDSVVKKASHRGQAEKRQLSGRKSRSAGAVAGQGVSGRGEQRGSAQCSFP